ncbi:MAG: hypothetical protein JXA36_04810 [Coriobacteriia bacterium]|nr:hypothetical protein [Coriobacteriia bacterium]
MKKSKAITLVSFGLVAGLVLGSMGVSYAATGTAAGSGLGVRMGQFIRDAGGRLVDVVADLTGLTADEVKAERAEGESLADIAAANGSSSEAVVSSALEARKAILDAKVADGSITQEQADAAYARMSERLTERVATDEVGPPSWAGNGRGRGAAGSGACNGSCIANQ